MHLIQKLRDLSIPVSSPVKAIQYLNSREDMKLEQYNNIVSELTDSTTSFENQRQAKYSFLYLVQNIIKKSNNTNVLDTKMLLSESTFQAKNYIQNNPWVFAQAEVVTKVDSNGKPKRKKGAKQIAALEIYKANINEDKKVIIQMFMDELDMSKAGATTYFYNAKKQVGE